MRRSIEQLNKQPVRQRLFLGIATAMLSLLTLPGSSFAQSVSEENGYEGVLEEVLVTARRRDENIQDVPIAISLLTDDILEDYNIGDLGDVSNIVPNSVISAGRATNSTIIAYIRGVGQNDPL